jgi:hypothetical protein
LKKFVNQVLSENRDIKTQSLPEDEDIYLTIELEQVDSKKYQYKIWAETEDETYQEMVLDSTEVQTIEEIIKGVDKFLKDNERYREIPSKNIFLIFALPKELMKKGVSHYLTNNGTTIGSNYTILLRGLERYRDVGENHLRETYRIVDWRSNWDSYKKAGSKKLYEVVNKVNSQEFEIDSQEFDEEPLIVLNHKIAPESFERLYKNAVPIALWMQNCDDYEKFLKLFSKENKKTNNIKLENLHKNIFKLKSRQTELKSDVYMLYDNPYRLPLDELAQMREVN